MFETMTGKSGTCCVVVKVAQVPPAPVLRRRSRLKAGASWRALLTVQAAMTVGITLAGPLHAAHAQTSLPSSGNTVVLSHYGVNENPFAISNGTHITTDFYGVYGSSGRYTLSNAGTVTFSQADGIFFKGGGTVSNSGTVGGAMSGGYAGILLSGRTSTIINSGTVTGDIGAEITHGGVIANAGTIGGGAIGAFVSNRSGDVYNSGSIIGATAVDLNAGGFVGNAGSILGGTIGIDITGAKGIVTNDRAMSANYIEGGDYGIVMGAPGGTLITRGFIYQSNFGFNDAAVMMNGGYIYNQRSISGAGGAGAIIGNDYGVVGTGPQALHIRNSGAIEGFINGVTFGAGGGTIVNGVDSYILGFEYAGINAPGGSLHVSNDGSIVGGQYGITAFTPTVSQYGKLGGVTVSNTGRVLGGHDGIFVNTGFTSITNTGTISGGTGNGIYAQTGGQVSNTGSIIGGGGSGIYINGSFGVVHNNGVETANYIAGAYAGVDINAPNGTLITRGLITESKGGYSNAAVIMNGGYLYNQAGGDGVGKAGTIAGYANAVIAFGSNPIDIINNGTIAGTAFDPIGETWTNGIVLGVGGGNITNGGSAVISGAYGNGVLSNYGSFAVNNHGSIIGRHYGIDSYTDSDSPTGGVSVSNFGTIIGGDGGIYVDTGYARIQNTGLIQGLNYEGIYAKAGATIGNSGTILGGDDGVSAWDGLTISNTGNGTIGGGQNGIYVGSGIARIINAGTIAGVHENGLYLQGGGTVFNSGTITGGHYGVYALTNAVTVGNSGLILGAVDTGIELLAGGDVYNSGSGTIVGNYNGVDIDGAYCSVTNHGVILGKNYAGVGIYDNGTVANIGGTISGYSGVQFGYGREAMSSTGAVFNSGVILGNSFAGVAMYNGGYVYNAPGGTIAALSSAGLGIVMYGTSGVVDNEGFIRGGSLGVGVSLAADGEVYNGGSIYGGTGVRISGTTVSKYDMSSTGVENVGSITGGSIGVDLVNGGYVGNSWRAGCDQEIGVIYGSMSGVQVDGGAVFIDNAGIIHGGLTGVSLAGSLAVVGNGDFVADAALHIGTIFGGTTGVLASGGRGYVYNAGVITGGVTGVGLVDGGIVRNVTYSTTIDDSPVSFAGTITGSEFGVLVGSLATGTVFNAGFIAGETAGVDLLGGGSITNYTNGIIIGEGYGVRIGTLPGYVNNAGLINGSGFGQGNRAVYLVKGGEVINQEGGVIHASEGGIQIGDSTADSLASPGLVLNSGQIYASCGSGIVMLNGGYVSNSSRGLIQNISFADGVYLYANPTISNAIFNAGGISGSHDGVNVAGDGRFTLVNAGSISGDVGVYIHASTVGTDVVMNTGSIHGYSDSGVILRGAGAFYLGNGNAGTIIGAGENSGVEVEANMASIVNAGTIYGGHDGVYGLNTSLYVTNLQSGTITGYDDDGVYSNGGQLSVDNAGQILSQDYEGIGAYDGSLAVILNESTGTIYGSHYGLDVGDAHSVIDNRGLVTSASAEAVYVEGTLSQILNEASGTIAGGDYGIYADADTFALDNAGLITTNGDDGVYSGYTSSVINEASGTITGPEFAVVLDGDYGTLQNAGLVKGDFAVVMESTLGSVLNTKTGVITGAQEGVFSEYGDDVANAGQITGYDYIGVQLYDGGELDNSGAIFGGEFGVSDYAGTSGGSFSNFVTIVNSGLIDGNEGGVLLYPVTGDDIINEASGVITGGTYGLWIGYSGSTAAVAGTVFNAGTILGGAAGINLYNGGDVTNYKGGVVTGGTYGIKAGYTGGTFAAIATVENAGLISGGDAGVDLVDGGSVVNTGTIIGGTDGIDFTAGDAAYVMNDGHITGGTGIGVELQGGELMNQSKGVIQGGADGVVAQNGARIINAGKIEDSPAPDHAGVVLYGQTSLTNLPTGTISGNVGVLVSGDQATIVDAGAIISTDGGDSIQILPSADPAQITLTTGAKLTGAIDGGGTGGTITLTGQNTLDDTIANFGAGSSLTVAPGATWVGAGNWTIANVNNTGTFQGGLLNAPLDLTGNFTSTGTLQVVVTPTISTHLNVSGTATFSGGLTYIFAPGTYTPGYKYNFVDAAGGASGKFTTVTYLGATPEYVSKTTHVLITGGILGSDLVLGRVAPLDGSIFADANQDAAQNAQAANDTLLDHAAGEDDANAAACAAATRVMPGQTDVRGTNLATQMTSAVANAFCGAGGWVEATGATSSIDASGGVPGYDANDAGFLAGLDRPVTGFGTKLGVAVGYDSAWLDDKAGGKASASTVRVGLYAAQPLGRFTIAADIMYGSASDTSTRPTGVGAASGSYGGNVVNGGLQISTGLDVNGFAVTPEAGLKFADVNTNGFSETAPSGLRAFAVRPQTSSYASVQPYLDVGLSKSFTTESLITITPSVSAGYQLEAGDRGKSVNVSAQDSTLFAGGHTNLDAGGAKIGASIAAGKGNWSLYARYNATLAGNYTAQAGEAGLQINF
jgi:hypothetical protein